MQTCRFSVTTPAVLCAIAVLTLAFVPFVRFWQGRDPDHIMSYIYCTMTYQIADRYFIPMIVFFWATFMNYVWRNFTGEVRRRLIIAGSINAHLHYMLGRTFYRDELHDFILIALLFSTIMIYVLSKRWNWILLFVFLLPGVLAFMWLNRVGGGKTDNNDFSRSVLWVYAISTHWPSLVFVAWLFLAPCMPVRTMRSKVMDRVFEFK